MYNSFLEQPNIKCVLFHRRARRKSATWRPNFTLVSQRRTCMFPRLRLGNKTRMATDTRLRLGSKYIKHFFPFLAVNEYELYGAYIKKLRTVFARINCSIGTRVFSAFASLGLQLTRRCSKPNLFLSPL